VNTMPFRLSLLAGFLQLCHASFDANLSTYINVQVPVTLHELNITGGLIHHQAQFGSHFNFLQQEGEIVAVTHDVHGSLCVMPDANITKEFGQPPFLLIAGTLISQGEISFRPFLVVDSFGYFSLISHYSLFLLKKWEVVHQ